MDMIVQNSKKLRNYKPPPIIKTSTYTTIAMQNAETFCMAIVALTERDISLIIFTG